MSCLLTRAVQRFMFEVHIDISVVPTPEKPSSPVFTPSTVPRTSSRQPPTSKHYWPPPSLSTRTASAPPSFASSAPKCASVPAFESATSSKVPGRDHAAPKTTTTTLAQAPTTIPIYLLDNTQEGPKLRQVSTPADLALFIKSLSSIPH